MTAKKIKKAPPKPVEFLPTFLNTPIAIDLVAKYFKEQELSFSMNRFSQENFKSKVISLDFNSKDLDINELLIFSKFPHAKAYTETRDNYTNFVISAETEEIILKKVNLGKFELKLSYHKKVEAPIYDENSAIMLAKALTPNPCIEDSTIVHPNINGSYICLGDVEESVDLALKQFRFSDAFELTVNMLKNISDSPYVHIDEWGDRKCTNCESRNDVGDCVKCSKELCGDCGTYCNKCGDGRYHSKCLKNCHECGLDICENCIIKSRWNYGTCCWEKCRDCNKPKNIDSVCKCYKPPKVKPVQAKPIVKIIPSFTTGRWVKGRWQYSQQKVIDLDPIYS